MLINTKEKNKVTVLEGIKQIKWIGIILCMIGFLMSRMLVFDTFYTLGICYIGALFYDKELRKWGALIGILGLVSVGLFSGITLKYICMILLLIGLRSYMNLTRTEFNIKNQAVLTSFSIISINIIEALVSGGTLLKIMVSLLEGAIGAGLVVIIAYSLEVIYKKRKTPLTEKEMISMAVFVACFLGGMVDFYIKVPLFKSIYFRDVLTFVIIIAVTYLGSMNRGIVISLIISTVLVIIGYMPPHFVAIYTFAALMGGLFHVLDRIGIIIAIGIGLLLGFALFNDRIIDLQIVGAYIGGLLISLCLPKSYFGIADWFDYEQEAEEERHLIRVQNIITERLQHFSKSFYNLSRTFDKIADKKIHLNQKDINHIIEDTGEKMCQNCSMKNFCWEDYIKATYQSSYEMLELMDKKGQLTLGEIPMRFKDACINPEGFACTLSFQLDLFKQNLLWKNRFVEARQLMGEQFEAVAESIKKLSQNIEKDFYFNKEHESAIREILHAKGIRTKDIIVLENNGHNQGIHIYTYYKQDIDLREKIVEGVSSALDMHVEIEKYENNLEEKYAYFKLKIKKAYGILASAQIHAKGKVSGDVYSFMEIEDGKYLLALADGMGSGKEAQQESTATIELLENFMDSGFDNSLAVKMINSILVLKSDIENFSTMDITLIDEYTGVAEFLKLGAAASFILRDQEVLTVKENSLPIGILDKVDIEIYKKQLKDGDLIIMVTDGMLEAKGEILGKEDTFKHFILEAKTNNPEYMAKHLMQKSLDLLGGAENDDMTIVVARIWKQS